MMAFASATSLCKRRYNNKTGYTTKDFKSINGSIYLNSFTKGHEPLSKTKEELESEDLLIKRQTKKSL